MCGMTGSILDNISVITVLTAVTTVGSQPFSSTKYRTISIWPFHAAAYRGVHLRWSIEKHMRAVLSNSYKLMWRFVLTVTYPSRDDHIYLISFVCFTVEPLQKLLQHLQMTIVGSKVHYRPAILRQKHNTHICTVFGMWHATNMPSYILCSELL